MSAFTAARALLGNAIGTEATPGVAPGLVALGGTKDRSEEVAALGVQRYGGAAVTPTTRYDLASLTKVVATLPSILRLVSDGELNLEDKVGKFFSNAGWFQTPSLAEVTVRQLLTHTSGLPAWKPLFATVSERPTAVANVLQTGLEHAPGTFVYSDFGFILLGAIVERVSGLRQDDFVEKHVFEPLGMKDTRYGPVPPQNVAATEDCGWRGQVLQGVVHDENAFVMDGVAGHAGLFGTAGDLGRYAQAWLNWDVSLGDAAVLRAAVEERVIAEQVRRGLGWQLAGAGSSAGDLASEAAFGHTGFTGTSLWIDPVQGWFAVLLTNRIHPTRLGGEGIQALRRAFHDEVASVLGRTDA
ncbi:serine hydrolase domain-containing protein [soil metagenome]